MLESFIDKQLQFTANLREPDRYPMPNDVEPARMELYQTIFFQNIHGILSRAFPVLKSMHQEDNWNAIVRDFFAKHKAKSPTYHEIPEEFLHYLSYVRHQDNDPAWMYELAHYEWLELSLELSPMSLGDVIHQQNGNLLNEIPIISPLAWLQVYQFPVHTISVQSIPETQPENPTFLIVYRNWNDAVEFMHINDFTHALLSILHQENACLTGREALDCLVSISNHPNPAMVIQGGSLLLENLRDRHIILGTRPC